MIRKFVAKSLMTALALSAMLFVGTVRTSAAEYNAVDNTNLVDELDLSDSAINAAVEDTAQKSDSTGLVSVSCVSPLTAITTLDENTVFVDMVKQGYLYFNPQTLEWLNLSSLDFDNAELISNVRYETEDYVTLYLTDDVTLQDKVSITMTGDMGYYSLPDTLTNMIHNKYGDQLKQLVDEKYAQVNKNTYIYADVWMVLPVKSDAPIVNDNKLYKIYLGCLGYFKELKSGATEPSYRESEQFEQRFGGSGEYFGTIFSSEGYSVNNEYEGVRKFSIYPYTTGEEINWPITMKAKSFKDAKVVSEVSVAKSDCVVEDQRYVWEVTEAFQKNLTRHEVYKVYAVDKNGKEAAGEVCMVCTVKKSSSSSGSSNTSKCPALSKSSLSILNGKKTTISIKNKPSKSTVTWASSNPSVATVTNKGAVVPVATGSTTITAKITKKDGTVTSLDCAVTVEKPELSAKEFAFTIGVSGKESGLVLLNNLLDGTDPVKWKSSKPAVVEVNEATGAITAKAAGKAVISTVRNKKTYKATVIVYNPEITGAKATLKVNKKFSLKIKNGKKGENVWTSSNPAVATVDNKGRVKAIAPGNVTISTTNADKPLSVTFDVVE